MPCDAARAPARPPVPRDVRLQDTARPTSGFVETRAVCGGVSYGMEALTAEPDEDRRLARRIEGGDAEAVRHLFDTHAERLYRLLFRLLGDADDAHDAVQEVLVRAVAEIACFRGPTLAGWLRSIAFRTGLNTLRAERRRRARERRWAMERELPSPRPVDVGLVRAIERLPEDYRRVVLLFYFEDQSHDAIAETLDIPIGTSKTWLYRARERLRSLLEPEVES